MKSFALSVLSIGFLSSCLPKQDEFALDKKNRSAEAYENGFYALSPTSLMVVWSRPEPWNSYQVYNNVGGTEDFLETLLSENKIINLRYNSQYILSLYGQDRSLFKSPTPLLSSSITTWDTFANTGDFSIEEGEKSENGRTVHYTRISINYDPFATLKAGPGVAANTFAECFISDARINNRINPFTDPNSIKKRFLLADAKIDLPSSELSFYTQKNISCKVLYADGTQSSILTYKSFRSTKQGVLAACPSSATQGQPYTCTLNVLDSRGNPFAGQEFELNRERTTCSWINELQEPITRTPIPGTTDYRYTISSTVVKNSDVQNCELVYNSKFISHPPLVHSINVINAAPSIQFKEPNSMANLKLNTIVVPENTDYPAGVSPVILGALFDPLTKVITLKGNLAGTNTGGQIVTNEEDVTITNITGLLPPEGIPQGESCNRHLESSMIINSGTKEIKFKFNRHFFGKCKFKIQVDDATGQENSKRSEVINVRVYPINDAPNYNFNAKAALASDSFTERCAKKGIVSNPTSSADFLGCVVGVQDSLNLILFMGGGVPPASPLTPENYDEVNANAGIAGQTARIKTVDAYVQNLYSHPKMTSNPTLNNGSVARIGDQIAIQDSATKADFLVSLSASNQVQFKPQNPDVTVVKLILTLEDSGYSMSEVNNYKRDSNDMDIYQVGGANPTVSLFAPKTINPQPLYVQVGEFMSRFTDFHVVYDTSSMGVSVINNNKNVINEWFQTKLRAIYSPKHQGNIYHRRLGDERWLGGYLAATVKVAYGNITASTGEVIPHDYEYLDSNVNSAGDPTGRFPKIYEDIRKAPLPSNLADKEIMMLSFCDESQGASWHTDQSNGHVNIVNMETVNAVPNIFDPFPAFESRFYSAPPLSSSKYDRSHAYLNYHGSAFGNKASNGFQIDPSNGSYMTSSFFAQTNAMESGSLTTDPYTSSELTKFSLFDFSLSNGFRFRDCTFDPVTNSYQSCSSFYYKNDTGWRATSGATQNQMTNPTFSNYNVSSTKFSVINRDQIDFFKPDYQLFENLFGQGKLTKNNFKGIAYPMITARSYMVNTHGRQSVQGASMDFLIHAMVAVMGKDYIDATDLSDPEKVDQKISDFMGPRNPSFSENEWAWLKSELVRFVNSPQSFGVYDRSLSKHYNWVGKWDKTTNRALTLDEFNADMMILRVQ